MRSRVLDYGTDDVQEGAAVTRDYIRMANTHNGGYAFLCLHCGDMYVPALPISIEMMLAAAKSFEKSNSRCKKPEVLFNEDDLLGRADIRHLINIEAKP